ncbi:MAG: NADH-quinone oxidoreductase subunit J [Actinomycetota bacterium]|nr:NADH-quinone oxidoreductase subunit J [Actinomycetota bacterium]
MDQLLAAAAPVAGPVAAATSGHAGAEQVMFWILAPLALLGAVGMVFSRMAVHSALWLALTMMSLGAMYILNQSEFLGFAQIIVYTGAIMMLFLFVLMLTGRDAGDSVIELLRGQRVAATILGIGFVALVATGLLRALQNSPMAGLGASLAERGPIGSIAKVLFTDYLFPFELTSALLITAAVGAMVLAHVERAPGERRSQRQRVTERMRSDQMSPLPGPGVFATSSSNATPALLPDGSIAPASVSALVERSESERVASQYASGHMLAELESGDQPRRPGDLGDVSADEQADAAQAAHDEDLRMRIAAEEDAR